MGVGELDLNSRGSFYHESILNKLEFSKEEGLDKGKAFKMNSLWSFSVNIRAAHQDNVVLTCILVFIGMGVRQVKKSDTVALKY